MRESDGRKSESRTIQVFTGHGNWVGELVRSSTHLSSSEREARVLAWLRSNGYTFPKEYIEVLALCDSASELRFILPILMLPEWTRGDGLSFTNGTYELKLQVPFFQYRLDFLLSGGELPFPCNIEVDGPVHRRDDVWRRDRERDRLLLGAKIGVYRIGSERVKDEGQRFREKFALEARFTPGGSTIIIPRGERKRMWPRIPEAFCLEEESIEERPTLVADWLATRGISVTEEQAEFLGWCDRGAEVLLIYPLISRPGWRMIGPRTFTDGVSFLTLQELIGTQRVDVIFEQPAISSEDDDLLLLADVSAPRYLKRNQNAEAMRQSELGDAGYHYQRIELYEYREVSTSWGRWIDWARERWEKIAAQ